MEKDKYFTLKDYNNMGWFSKKEQPGKREEVPLTLPELPKLPEFPKLDEDHDSDDKIVHKLPSFPTTSIGNKFSQNTIKEAVSGKKEEEVFDANDFELPEDYEEIQKMHQPLRKPMTREIGPSIKKGEGEPVFIRIDKFEESLHVFEKAKHQIKEVEKLLKDIKKIRTKEEDELEFWEKEMQSIKNQVEKVDQDIFSKIE